MKRELIVTHEGQDRSITIEPLPDGRFRVAIGDTVREVDARLLRPGTWSLILDGKSYVVDLDKRRGGIAASVGAGEALLQVEDALHRRLAAAAHPRGEKARGEKLQAPIAGKVVKVLVAIGDSVAPGTAVIVLEAMKMENELVAERGGTVSVIHKQAGQAVETGETLVELT
ncbi:MAG: biotin/lipoyl attachment protein [Myxococcales bacterium]|nr:biotin/lipoyl attachment protein [Myxococcales bacterium]